MIQRREGRELVIKALFAEDVSKNDWDHGFNYIIKSQFKSDEKNFHFAEKLYYRTLNNRAEIDEIIQNHIKNWRN